MKEEFVNFDTANLAEEKGYPFEFAGDIPMNIPTQSLLQRWLREVHNFHIVIDKVCNLDSSKTFWSFEICYTNNEDIIKEPIGGYDTYEQALEIGLQESLKLI